MLANRDWGLIGRSIIQPEHYRALLRARAVYEHPKDSLQRYFFGSGKWPADIGLRTPMGTESVRVYSVHDMFTVHEVFCREDYRMPSGSRTVVDIGSNIGISARYFLSHAPGVHVHMFEPVPTNVERLRQQLADCPESWTLTEAAVADHAGKVEFGVEETGRYGAIGADLDESIEVECLGINDVLDGILSSAEQIDLLKIDTEGAEVATLEAIRPELLSRIRSISLETYENPNPDPRRFKGSRQVMVRRLDRLEPAGW